MSRSGSQGRHARTSGRSPVNGPRYAGFAATFSTRFCRPQHIFAAAAFIFFALISVWVYKSLLPPICYVLLLVTVLIWLVSGLTFFFDAYRVPVLVPLVLFLWLCSLDPRSDHYFRIKSPLGTEIPGTSPGEVLARAQEDENPIVLIASAGGGIQAAAWTARVLTGLEEEVNEVAPGAFPKSIRCLSGVSGGSTGIMYDVQATYPLDKWR